MDNRKEIERRVLNIMDRLSKPLAELERGSGWTEESRVSMLEFFRRLKHDIETGRAVEDVAEYRAIVRGMDCWGVVQGELLEEAAAISSLIRRR